jgi:hypothetical protein
MKRSAYQWLAPILFVLLMACNPSTVASFKLKAQDLTVLQGETGTISIAIERDSSDTTPIDLILEQAGAQALPSGLSGTFSPTPSTGSSSSLNILAEATVAAKTYALQIKGSTASGVAQTAAFNLVVQPGHSFAVLLDPANLSVVQGQSGSLKVSLNRTNFTDPIAVSLQGAGGTALPNGISATFTANASGGSFTILVANATAIKEHALEVKAVGGGITNATPFFLTVTAPTASDLTLELNPGTLDVTQGLSGTVAVTLTRSNLTADAIISLQGAGGAVLPAGISSAGTTITATTGSLEIKVAASTAVNNYSLEVKAVAGGITKVKPLTLNVVAPIASDFSMTVNPVTLSLEQGKSGTTTVNIVRNNFTPDITVSLQGSNGANLPTGISAPNVTVTGNTATLNITTSATLAANNYSLEIKAIGAGVTKTTPFTLTVTAKPDFTLSSNPSGLSIEQAKSATVAITIARTNFTASIPVVLQGQAGIPLPTGIGFGFAATSTGGTLTVNVADTAAVQTSNLEIKAQAGGIVKTTPLTLTVSAKPGLSLAISTPNLTIEPTYFADVGITLTRTGVTGAVTVSLQGTGDTALAAGITAASVNITGDTGTLSIAVANSVAAQDYNLEVKAVGGGVTQTAPLKLTVLAAPFAVNKTTATILEWSTKSGQVGDFLSATSDSPTVANYTTPISATGVVSYDLPVPTVLSDPATLLGSYCNQSQNLSFNPTTIKGTERLFGAPSAGKYGSLVLSNQDVTTPAVGLEQAFVVYLDGDLNVSGTCTGQNAVIFNVTVNAALKQGWNILVGKVTKIINSTAVVTLEVEVSSRTTVPSRYAWRWYPR